MSDNIVYEKTYPRDDLTAIDLADEDGPTPSREELRQQATALYEELTNANNYEPLPNRLRRVKEFISLAISASSAYRLDTIIRQERYSVSVTYSFDSGTVMQRLYAVLSMADSYSFFTGKHGRDITLRLDFYTHLVRHNNRWIAP